MIVNLSLRVIAQIPWDDWLERDIFRLGLHHYRVTGYNTQTRALQVEPVDTHDSRTLPTMHTAH